MGEVGDDCISAVTSLYEPVEPASVCVGEDVVIAWSVGSPLEISVSVEFYYTVLGCVAARKAWLRGVYGGCAA